MHAILLLTLLLAFPVSANDTIPLYESPPDTQSWTGGPRSYFSDAWQTQVETNVSVPTLTPFMPDSNKTGVGVVVAPGGGFHALSINSEGNDVAKWLNERGVAAFVLRYRLVPSGKDGVSEMQTKSAEKRGEDMSKYAPLAGADGLRAMEIVRARADEFGIDPEKIGFMGFSAGGTVTMHVAYHHDEDSRPAFVAPIYAAHRWFKDMAVTGPLPPAFIVAATDDQLNLAIDSIDIYQRWLKVNVPAELHMYARGGHGFGMRKQNLPSDTWIERFGDWLGTLE